MLIKRFQAWRIAPKRANEFKRTDRRPGPRPMLFHRVLAEAWGSLHLAKAWPKQLKRPKVRSRPPARTGKPNGRFDCGQLRCVRTRCWPREFCHPTRRGSTPPCSPAAHWLERIGYTEVPF